MKWLFGKCLNGTGKDDQPRNSEKLCATAALSTYNKEHAKSQDASTHSTGWSPFIHEHFFLSQPSRPAWVVLSADGAHVVCQSNPPPVILGQVQRDGERAQSASAPALSALLGDSHDVECVMAAVSEVGNVWRGTVTHYVPSSQTQHGAVEQAHATPDLRAIRRCSSNGVQVQTDGELGQQTKPHVLPIPCLTPGFPNTECASASHDQPSLAHGGVFSLLMDNRSTQPSPLPPPAVHQDTPLTIQPSSPAAASSNSSNDGVGGTQEALRGIDRYKLANNTAPPCTRMGRGLASTPGDEPHIHHTLSNPSVMVRNEGSRFSSATFGCESLALGRHTNMGQDPAYLQGGCPHIHTFTTEFPPTPSMATTNTDIAERVGQHAPLAGALLAACSDLHSNSPRPRRRHKSVATTQSAYHHSDHHLFLSCAFPTLDDTPSMSGCSVVGAVTDCTHFGGTNPSHGLCNTPLRQLSLPGPLVCAASGGGVCHSRLQVRSKTMQTAAQYPSCGPPQPQGMDTISLLGVGTSSTAAGSHMGSATVGAAAGARAAAGVGELPRSQGQERTEAAMGAVDAQRPPSLSAISATSQKQGADQEPYASLAGGVAGGSRVGGDNGGREKEGVYDVTIKATRHPETQQRVLVVYVEDITSRAQLEAVLGRLAEGQLTMTAQMFPIHILAALAASAGSSSSSSPMSAGALVGAGVGMLGGGCLPTLQQQLARSHQDATLLFMDVVGFTSMCKVLEAHQVMGFINALFSLFDALVEVHGVHKVETAGDCYIVSAGVVAAGKDGLLHVVASHDPADSAARVFAMARDMLAAAQSVQMPHSGEPTQIRIGLHTGPCTSGLVGSRLPKFSLFGDSMNTASRMESTAPVGRIQVSEATHKWLQAVGAKWEATGGVEVKGKGVMSTWLWVPPSTPSSELPRPPLNTLPSATQLETMEIDDEPPSALNAHSTAHNRPSLWQLLSTTDSAVFTSPCTLRFLNGQSSARMIALPPLQVPRLSCSQHQHLSQSQSQVSNAGPCSTPTHAPSAPQTATHACAGPPSTGFKAKFRAASDASPRAVGASGSRGSTVGVSGPSALPLLALSSLCVVKARACTSSAGPLSHSNKEMSRMAQGARGSLDRHGQPTQTPGAGGGRENSASTP